MQIEVLLHILNLIKDKNRVKWHITSEINEQTVDPYVRTKYIYFNNMNKILT